MEEIRKYDNYKDSGIDWVGEIPEHWGLKKFGQVSYMKGRIGWQGLKQTEFTQNSEDPFLITGMNFHSGIIRWDEVYHITEDRYEQAPEIQLKNYDVLITKDGTIGKLLFVEEIPYPFKASLNSHLLVLRPLNDSYYPRYLYYQLQSLPFKHHVELTKTGTTFFGITQEAMGQYKIILPAKKEQKSIANFLDRKTAEIDRIIANKQKLITFYEEEKQAIIKHAVTKGLDTNVTLKDSGIIWLGEIPKHWEQKNLKYLARVQTGGTPKIQNAKMDYFADGTINWYTPSDFYNDGVLEDSNRKINEFAVEESEVEIFPENSVYLVSIGATLGKVGLSKTKASANQQINVIIFDKSLLNPFYGYYFLVSNKEMIKLEADYTTLPILNQTKTKSLTIAYPNLKEQYKIVQYIDKECERINTILEKFNKQIDLLKEYRTTLISEVVTGKIKVPNTIEV